MQTKFSLEISRDYCRLVFRDKPTNIILLVDGVEHDVCSAQNCNSNYSPTSCNFTIFNRNFLPFSTVTLDRAQKVKMMPRNIGALDKCPLPRDVIDESK